MKRLPLPKPTQLRLDLALDVTTPPLAEDPTAVVRTLAGLMLEVLYLKGGEQAGGGDEPEADR